MQFPYTMYGLNAFFYSITHFYSECNGNKKKSASFFIKRYGFYYFCYGLIISAVRDEVQVVADTFEIAYEIYENRIIFRTALTLAQTSDMFRH